MKTTSRRTRAIPCCKRNGILLPYGTSTKRDVPHRLCCWFDQKPWRAKHSRANLDEDLKCSWPPDTIWLVSAVHRMIRIEGSMACWFHYHDYSWLFVSPGSTATISIMLIQVLRTVRARIFRVRQSKQHEQSKWPSYVGLVPPYRTPRDHHKDSPR